MKWCHYFIQTSDNETGAVATADDAVEAMTEKYNPYLTMRRNIQHADEDFTNVMWLHKVLCFYVFFNFLPAFISAIVFPF